MENNELLKQIVAECAEILGEKEHELDVDLDKITKQIEIQAGNQKNC